ncbi:Gmad2 immunoglobulin-like domain-containing protein [Autumnicola edwardsiae]|uniref:Gmad2 immunoglobulin-like domain-containing protein n=1 Tax=Autumnicola edwardsiae TaxID=3075594 RepID=A0ABU3CWI1_9FLAO|nr:Gmad2 immunoglobulin-like domain-containing protein [Zunongwangia sp. F297]MDT0650715.1 Gmad2 immunoglobulin-like domain-containing protein [Zunongwangia sp. F297]
MLKIKEILSFLIVLILFSFCFSCNEHRKEKSSTENSVDGTKTEDASGAKSNAENGNFRQSVTEKDENWQISDSIIVEQPIKNEKISSPLQIKGKARGYWFFEASAPVVLVNNDQKEIATGIIEAKGDWMTEDFVPFEGELEFNAENSQNGYLILKRANPSGKTDIDQKLILAVEF